jgi:formylglycine-generating enzyme required for sulfatase activity
MLVTAMVVQAFGFVGSAGANTQTVEILEVQSNATSITVTYTNADYGVRVRVNGTVASKTAGSWNSELNAPIVILRDLPTSNKITLEIAALNRYGELGPYVTKEVYGSFVSIGEKKDPKIKSVTTSRSSITVGWDADTAVDYYIVQLRQNGRRIWNETTYGSSMTFYNLKSGKYTVRLYALFKDDSGSNWDKRDVEVPVMPEENKYLLKSHFVQVGYKNTLMNVPIGSDNILTTVLGGFWIGTTEVTYDEWYDVRLWAEKNGYTFANIGREGHDGVVGAAPTSARDEPVTEVSWRDVIVWSNAKSQKDGFLPVYVSSDREILKNAKSPIVDNAVQRYVNGYRLPTNNEWEMAARWLGTTDPETGSLAKRRIATPASVKKHYFTPGNYASGAVEDVWNEGETGRVAWYRSNSSDGTKAVGKKAPNALGMYDVTGNVWEWTFDTWDSNHRTVRGGSWFYDSTYLPVSYVYPFAPTFTYFNVGFRLSRTFITSN